MRYLRRMGFLMLFFAAGCVSHSTPRNVVVSGPLPQDIRRVDVHILPISSSAIKNIDGAKDLHKTLAGLLKTALASKQPNWESDVLDSLADSPQADLLVVTEVLQLDGGSAGLRFFIGFSAGAAESSARIQIKDKANREIAAGNISTSRMCPIGACIISNETMTEEVLRDLAAEIAEFVVSPSDYQKRRGA